MTARPTDAVAGVLGALADLGLTLAVAESLTGGLLAARLTAVPGASAVFRGGVVAYATDVKAGLLGVDPALLARVGAVDPLVARQMAEGVRRVLAADLAVATTGVAGPEGQDGYPPGTVWVSVADATGSWVVDVRPAAAAVLSRRLGGDTALADRQAVREVTCDAAWAAVLRWAGGRRDGQPEDPSRPGC